MMRISTKIMQSCALGLCLASSPSFAQTCNNEAERTAASGFIDNGNGTVTQKSQHLMWAKCSLGQSGKSCTGAPTPQDWHKAIDAAKASKLAGFSDWRLPSIGELEALVETKCHDPAINIAVFPNTPSTGFWSSSEVLRLPSNAKALFFFYGEPSNFYKRNAYNVRLVRTAR